MVTIGSPFRVLGIPSKVCLRMVPGRLKEEYDQAMPEIAVGMGDGGLASIPPAPTVPP